MTQKPSNAFIGASWIALGAGMLGYLIGLWRAEMQLNEKGYYFTVLMFGLSWFATILSIILLIIGLWNATLLSSEKGFYAFAFLLAMFGAITVQKNTRDSQQSTKKDS
jgi:uncharacterized membrane protein YiaA